MEWHRLWTVPCPYSMHILVWQTCASALSSWVSYRLLELTKLMPQSHHTLGPRTGCSRAVPRVIWTKIVRPLTGLVRRHANFASPYGARRVLIMHYKLTDPYGFRDCKQPVNSPCGPHKGPVRAPYGQIRRPCASFANSGCVNSLTCP